jgi:hypothetical protein
MAISGGDMAKNNGVASWRENMAGGEISQWRNESQSESEEISAGESAAAAYRNEISSRHHRRRVIKRKLAGGINNVSNGLNGGSENGGEKYKSKRRR